MRQAQRLAQLGAQRLLRRALDSRLLGHAARASATSGAAAAPALGLDLLLVRTLEVLDTILLEGNVLSRVLQDARLWHPLVPVRAVPGVPEQVQPELSAAGRVLRFHLPDFRLVDERPMVGEHVLAFGEREGLRHDAA